MNQCFCPGFAAAVVVSSIGAPLPANAEQITRLEASGDVEAASSPPNTHFSEPFSQTLNRQETVLEVSSSPSNTHFSAPLFSHPLRKQENRAATSNQASDLTDNQASHFQGSYVDNQASDLTTESSQTIQTMSSSQINLPLEVSNPEALTPNASAPDASSIVRVIPHALDLSQAATLYVNGIPVLTFVGQELEILSEKINEGLSEQFDSTDIVDPEVRAMKVARRLDQFHQASGNPETILVRWDPERQEYVIDVADEVLVVINGATILPDTTDDFAVDALQATNRLRRLLGGAEPLQEVRGKPTPQPEASARANWTVDWVATGNASWYGPGFHGRRTASGEIFNQNAMTAAHRTLPFGTLVRVTNLSNNRQVIVRINDRGPFRYGRILDLSARAAQEIGLERSGVGPIRLEILSE